AVPLFLRFRPGARRGRKARAARGVRSLRALRRRARARIDSRPDRRCDLRALEARLGAGGQPQRVPRALPPLPAAAPPVHHAASRAAAGERGLQRRRRARARGRLDPGRRRGPAPARELLRGAERAHAAPARDHALRGRAARGRCGRLHPAAALQLAVYARSRTITMNEKLLELARAYGIILDYYDIWGQQHHAAEHVLRTILQAMGVAAADDGAVEASAARMLRERWAQ